jgi:PTH2 family peptidyl-tRNA hydrolase
MGMKQIILMRVDLGMGKGKMVAQGAHASLKASIENLGHPSVIKWLEDAFTKVCVKVHSEEELFELVEKAKQANLISAVICDSGRTEFHGVPTNTCAAIGPATNEELAPITGHLRLL